MNKQITQQVSHQTYQKRKLKWVMNLVFVVLATELPDPVQNENVGSLVKELFRTSRRWQKSIRLSAGPF